MECIYNFVSEPQSEHSVKPRYRSKYDPKAPLTGSTFGLHGTTVTVGKGINELKKTCVVSSTFGPPSNKSVATPKQFLRKNTGNPCTRAGPKPTNDKHRKTEKAKVPKRDDKPIMGLITKKNFLTSNAAEAILSVPPVAKSEGVNFMKKETYGKVPPYLDRVKEEIATENDLVDSYVRRQVDGGKEATPEFDEMDEADRHSLLNDLKRKWDEVNGTYQKMCHKINVETFGDIKRKEAQEKELKTLEEYIEKLSKPGPVLIQRMKDDEA